MGLGSFLFLVTLGLAWPIYRQWKRWHSERARVVTAFHKALEIGLSVDSQDYLFPEGSAKRSNKIERRFRRRYHFDLLEIFDHCCANCKRSHTKLEIDHFFIPKSSGGNLMMQHRQGYWVSNAILLCRRCNANKADQGINDFFEEDTLKEILIKNNETSKIINSVKKGVFSKTY